MNNAAHTSDDAKQPTCQRSLLTRLGFEYVERAKHPHRAVLPSDHLFQLNRSA